MEGFMELGFGGGRNLGNFPAVMAEGRKWLTFEVMVMELCNFDLVVEFQVYGLNSQNDFEDLDKATRFFITPSESLKKMALEVKMVMERIDEKSWNELLNTISFMDSVLSSPFSLPFLHSLFPPAITQSPTNATLHTHFKRIGFSGEVPLIPASLSREGKDFLDKCFEQMVENDGRLRSLSDTLL
ncbi:hypothetical protein OSB04_000330 [Centaurea solstitialis]|uniref:Uncharacterized protein n=1 Tax=Centaurea solstitialis TaxID=347529 RepID=A0AA38WTS8_9ASTR|nr:hypothetical protein OSB04_000330 [Centaurea solstitialis]